MTHRYIIFMLKICRNILIKATRLRATPKGSYSALGMIGCGGMGGAHMRRFHTLSNRVALAAAAPMLFPSAQKPSRSNFQEPVWRRIIAKF